MMGRLLVGGGSTRKWMAKEPVLHAQYVCTVMYVNNDQCIIWEVKKIELQSVTGLMVKRKRREFCLQYGGTQFCREGTVPRYGIIRDLLLCNVQWIHFMCMYTVPVMYHPRVLQ